MNNETESESETSLRARVSVFRVWDSLFYYKKVLLLPQFWWKHCIERIYESETETESSQSHWLESESETETSPEPRDSGFRVRDERLGKFCCVMFNLNINIVKKSQNCVRYETSCYPVCNSCRVNTVENNLLHGENKMMYFKALFWHLPLTVLSEIMVYRKHFEKSIEVNFVSFKVLFSPF